MPIDDGKGTSIPTNPKRENELGAATLAARQKEFVQKNSGIVFGEFFHFLDSMIVQGR